jgi:hypothetical protein
VRVDASEVKALRRELRRLRPESPEWSKKFAQINKQAGEIIVSEARARASSGSRQQATAAQAIKASASQRGVQVRIAGGSGVPYALAAFWGMKRRSGWYSAKRYAASMGRQTAPWVGSSWEVGGPGGPYAINPAIRAKLDEVLDQWGDAVEELMDELDVN